MSLHNIQYFLSGEVFRRDEWRKQYKWLGMLAVLAFVYISVGYRAEAQQHRLVELDQEIADAKIEWLTVSAELTQRTRQSCIQTALQERNSPLQTNNQPLVFIP